MRFAIVLMAVGLLSGSAHADILDNAGTWRREGSGSYRLGFVAAVASHLMYIENFGPYGPQIRTGYGRCLADQRIDTLVQVVDAYLDKTAVANTYAPVIAVQMALHDMCATYLPHAPQKP